MAYILTTDETNLDPSHQAIFFIYGGIFLLVEQLRALTEAIEAIRVEYGFAPADSLKFATGSRPENVNAEQHRHAKAAVIEACLRLGVRFVAQLVHHGIARNHDRQVLISRGANTIFAAFDRFLEQEDSFGICIVDRMPFREDYDFLREKFVRGMVFDDGRPDIPLRRIGLFASSSNGASHVSSATDIVLGAFRHCVNERDRLDVPTQLLPKVVQMMWHHQIGDTLSFQEYGLILRPQEIAVAEYRNDYDDLLQHLDGLLQQA